MWDLLSCNVLLTFFPSSLYCWRFALWLRSPLLFCWLIGYLEWQRQGSLCPKGIRVVKTRSESSLSSQNLWPFAEDSCQEDFLTPVASSPIHTCTDLGCRSSNPAEGHSCLLPTSFALLLIWQKYMNTLHPVNVGTRKQGRPCFSWQFPIKRCTCLHHHFPDLEKIKWCSIKDT